MSNQNYNSWARKIQDILKHCDGKYSLDFLEDLYNQNKLPEIQKIYIECIGPLHNKKQENKIQKQNQKENQIEFLNNIKQLNQQKFKKKQKRIRTKNKKAKSDKYEQKVVSYQQILREKINKMNLNISDEPKQGEIEMMFLVLINGLTGSFTRDKKSKFILPTYQFLADVLKCTVDWVGQLIKKHQKRLGLSKIKKFNYLSKEDSWMGKFKNFVWVIYTGFNFDFKETNIYFFRTKKWKDNLKRIIELKKDDVNYYQNKKDLDDIDDCSFDW